jgi:hypothetical protein
MRLEPESAPTLDRRRFFQATAATATAAGVSGSLASADRAAATGDSRRTEVPPKPIPGGIDIPGLGRIHVFAPGDPAVTLPFTGTTLQGLDFEPNTITDFRGFSAVAFHLGTATGSDGETYDLETDMRAFQGRYVDEAGERRFGTFAFI